MRECRLMVVENGAKFEDRKAHSLCSMCEAECSTFARIANTFYTFFTVSCRQDNLFDIAPILSETMLSV